MIECEKCKKSFPQNYLLLRHMKRKFPCVKNDELFDIYTKEIDDITNKIDELKESSLKEKTICKYCDCNFSKKGNLERHINNYCTSKKNMENDRNKIINKKNKLENDVNMEKLQEKIKKQENDISNLKIEMNKIKTNKQDGNITIQKQIINNITNNNTNNNTNNLTININSFGKESLSHITLEDYKKYFTGFFPGFIKFIEKIHFDDSAPENHNINITNLKSKYIDIYENKQWITKQRKDVLEKFIRKKYNLLDDKCNELEQKQSINEKIIDEFRTFQENYQDEEAQKNTQNKIALMIYNNRNKINKKIIK